MSRIVLDAATLAKLRGLTKSAEIALAATFEVFEAAQVVVVYSAVYYPRRQL